MNLFGQSEPPAYDLTQIKQFPIAMFCGREDLLSSSTDYKQLAANLTANDSLIYFKEYDMGHLGFLMPLNRQHLIEVLELCREFNPDYHPCEIPGSETKEELEEVLAGVASNVSDFQKNKVR